MEGPNHVHAYVHVSLTGLTLVQYVYMYIHVLVDIIQRRLEMRQEMWVWSKFIHGVCHSHWMGTVAKKLRRIELWDLKQMAKTARKKHSRWDHIRPPFRICKRESCLWFSLRNSNDHFKPLSRTTSTVWTATKTNKAFSLLGKARSEYLPLLGVEHNYHNCILCIYLSVCALCNYMYCTSNLLWISSTYAVHVHVYCNYGRWSQH